MLNYHMMKGRFPIHGFIGFVFLLISEILHLKKVEPFYSWFYCFAWWSYIIAIDGIIYCIKRNSLIINRTKEFFLMIPWSIFIWLIFEAANLSLKNWYYINIPHSIIERWLGYAVAYGTVLPGLFETKELLESLGLFRKVKGKKIIIPVEKHNLLILLGVICLVSSILIPRYFFSLIWVGFIFLLEPFNYRFGGRSILKDLEEGRPGRIYLLLLSGLICGILWEFWNFWARSKWIYTVPFFEERKGFEMPFLGFLGFPPFALEAYVMYEFISLFRFQRGWEESTYRINLERKTGLLIKILTGCLMVSFFILIFRAIDQNTVDSYYPRLKDAYWIAPHYRDELPKAGILSLEDLILKTKDKNERDELALRLLVPKEELKEWIEKAELVFLKGIGIENLKLLEMVGINSVSNLASGDIDKLYKRMEKIFPNKTIPNKAKLKIWIREAKKKVQIGRDEP